MPNKHLGEHLGEHIASMQGRHVVVVGDVMLDAFVEGRVTRISPEAPIPVLSHGRTRHMPGGAANVARNLAHLGIKVTLIGVVGDDKAAHDLSQSLADETSIAARLITDPSRPTTHKTRFVGAGQQMLRVDIEDTSPPVKPLADKLAAMLTESLGTADAVIFSDYNKGVVGRALVETALNHQRRDEYTILADPKCPDRSQFGGIDLLTPNLAELSALMNVGSPLDEADTDSVNKTANALIRKIRISGIFTTMGAAGLLLSDGSDSGFHTASTAKSVYDVSGAGDTVIAVLAAMIGGGGVSYRDAAPIANIAAGIVVGKAGTATISPGELLADFFTRPAASPLDAVSRQCRDWRKNGQRISFTNGCFDCLHPGHLRLLSEAAAMGDRLVVGLNSDRSVRGLKGKGRPLQHEQMRASALAALPFVDAVFIFDEDTPLEPIREITPDILVKGGDYAVAGIIGAHHVHEHGGEVRLVPLSGNFSTSRLQGERF